MTLNQLAYFQRAATLEHVGKAAQALHISQPSLSVALSNLERELGISLFEKSGRGVSLTGPGRIFLGYADEILAMVEEAATHMSRLGKEAEELIRISYIAPLATFYLPKTIRGFLDQPGNQGIHMHFRQDLTPSMIDKLESGACDVLFCSESPPNPSLVQVRVIVNPLVLIVAEGHELCYTENVTFRDVASYPLITYHSNAPTASLIDTAFREHGCAPSIYHRVPSEQAIIELVAQRFGIAMIAWTSEEADPRIRIVPVEGNHYTRAISMVYSRKRKHSAVVRRFIDYIAGLGVQEVRVEA